jgi:hypothetical protein
MKTLLTPLTLLTVLLFSTLALAKPVCTTNQGTDVAMAVQDANTAVPKFLQGATITITKADGSKETVKSEDYMVVKRKHPRPVMVHVTNNTVTCTETTNVVPEDQKYSKNIVSLGVLDGYSDVDASKIPGGVKLNVDRQIGVGFKYQRAYNNRFYFGLEADTNQGKGFFGGVGF